MVHRSALILVLAALPCLAGDKIEQEILKTMNAMKVLIAAGQNLEAAGRPEEALKAYGMAVQIFERLEARLDGKSTGVLVGAAGGVVRGAPVAPAPVRPPRRLRPARPSRWDPPGDLDHLETTPKAQREQIDRLVEVMLDPTAGADSLKAKAKLAAIGKPAFPRVLGAMARLRDQIADQDTMQERLMESSLKLGDECLRGMDGYLNAKAKGVIRPGSDKRYIRYILRLHFKRWKQVLKGMAKMPGPYDPAMQQPEEDG